MIGQKINNRYNYNSHSNIFKKNSRSNAGNSNTLHKNNQINFPTKSSSSSFNNDQVTFSGGAISSLNKAAPKLNCFERLCSRLAKVGQTKTEAVKFSTGKAMVAPAAIALYPSKTDRASRAYSAALQPVEGAVRFAGFITISFLAGCASGKLAAKGILGKFFTKGSKEVVKKRAEVLKDAVTVGGTLLCVPITSTLVDKAHPKIVPFVMNLFKRQK